MIERITATLRAAGQAISFDYDFNRLKSIAYPQFADQNVTFEYGGPEDTELNQAGRIKQATHRAGQTVREYGKLGEVVTEIRTLGLRQPQKTYTTRFVFDTFGRMLKLTYPDGEVLRHTYDSGGNLARIVGSKQNQSFNYLDALHYDKFERRVFQRAGNGVETTFAYKADNRRLERLTSLQPGKPAADAFQQLLYGYDDVGNITDLVNSGGPSGRDRFGGPAVQKFAYDKLYRLTCGEGVFTDQRGGRNHYKMEMSYNSIHNITRKDQKNVLVTGEAPAPKCEQDAPVVAGRTVRGKAYDWAYEYGTSGKPHAPSKIGDRIFHYDANGNQAGELRDFERRTLQQPLHRI